MASPEVASVANEERTSRRGTPPRPWDANAGAELSVEKVTLPGAEQSATTGLGGTELSSHQLTVAEVLLVRSLRSLDDDQVLQIAEGIRAQTGASSYGDPRGLAFHLGIDVVPGFPEAGETSTATEAVFSWHHDRRERGVRIYCAVVRSFFLARRIAHYPQDVWALAIELVLPMRDRWIGHLTLNATQRFCPESVICAYVPDT